MAKAANFSGDNGNLISGFDGIWSDGARNDDDQCDDFDRKR